MLYIESVDMEELRTYSEITLVLLYKIREEFEQGESSVTIVRTCMAMIPEMERLASGNEIILN